MSYEIALDQLKNKLNVLDTLFAGADDFNDGTFNSVRKLVKENCNKMTVYLPSKKYDRYEVVSKDNIVYVSKIGDNLGNLVTDKNSWEKIGNLEMQGVVRFAYHIQFNKDLTLNFGSQYVFPIEKISDGIYRITFKTALADNQYQITTSRENLGANKEAKVNELVKTKTTNYFEIESYNLADNSLFDSDILSILIFKGE